MENKQYLIAIGASAGGISQINSFFDHTPLDSASYVIIQHLSSDYKSMMALLLARHSKLNIVEAEQDMAVEVNKIYLIPAASVMVIKNGRLLLEPKKEGINLTINTFFTSLAEERGDKAIGVILSGTGADGTEGMKAIKNAGGMLLASDPASCEFDQMPESIIAAGVVDHVVPPHEMPEIIQRYIHEKAPEIEIPDKEEEEKTVRAIIDLIKNNLPEDFSNYKENTILRRIKRRSSLYNFTDLNSYYNVLKRDKEELKNLAKDFLISVTSFFRDKDAFQVVEKNILPELVATKQNEDIKAWVAGCATGEEAYSLAILIRERLDLVKMDNNVKIFATDIDSEALQFAGKGRYNETIQKDVTPERLEKYFTRDEYGYRIKPGIRNMIIFSHHDLVKNPPYCNMDLISCRNLLIYMNPQLQKKILGMLHFGLKYGGYLFLGPSENVADLTDYLEEIAKKWKIYKNIEAKRMINFETFITPVLFDTKANIKPLPQQPETIKKRTSAPDQFDTQLLIDVGYAGVWIDQNNQVISSFGNCSNYLLQKMFVNHLPDLLSKLLAIAFTAASIEADKTGQLITVKGIKVQGGDSTVSLRVKPLWKNEAGEFRRLVLFSEDDGGSHEKSIVFDEDFFNNKYTATLEEELRITKENLSATYELLHASNENMQSFNEELLSANEEMQSTNEEMQSVNEELQTINAEYHAKIKELSDLNDDLNNYFRSNQNGQIFVDKDLLLKRFSPGAATHINLLETDINRPLSNISTNIKFETIDDDIKAVLKSGGVITKEVQAANGKWYHIMTMPYVRKESNVVDGAIITFNDITALKQSQKELEGSNRSLRAINNDLDNFVYTASHDLLSPINNIEQIIYLIKDKAMDSETVEYVNMLSSSVSKFRGVIKEMATIGKIESEMLKTEPIDVNEMLEEILRSIEWKISSEGAEIETDIQVTTITFSRKNFRSMLFNLINNALKFRSPDRAPRIMISTEDAPDHIQLSVKDNGIGISDNKIESIFKMYKRLNEEAEGQGLGLFLIKKMIDASGGDVKVESEVGEGTEFKLCFKK